MNYVYLSGILSSKKSDKMDAKMSFTQFIIPNNVEEKKSVEFLFHERDDLNPLEKKTDCHLIN